jgi:magnesium chelatase family protein
VDRIRAQLPSLTVVGLPDTAVREAKERILAAVRRLGRRTEPANVVINLSPADERKEGATLDLPMAAAFLAAAGHLPIDRLANRLLLGELSLEGRLQPVRGVLPIALAARDHGVPEIVLPAANAREAGVVAGIEVVAVATLGQVVEYLRSGTRFEPKAKAAARPAAAARSPTSPTWSDRSRRAAPSRWRRPAATTCC